MRRLAVLVWCVLAAGTAGCARLGFAGAPAPARDAETDAPRDGSAGDARVEVDAPGETGPDIGVSCMVAGCVECEPVGPPASCTPCSTGDCDVLADIRDPWPQTCNALIYAEDFADAALEGWVKTLGALAITVRPCGKLVLDPPANTTTELRSDLALPKPTLVEVALLLPAGGAWSFTLSVDGSSVTGSNRRACSIERDDTGTVVFAEVRTADGAPVARGAAIHVPIPHGLVRLQSYISGETLLCRWLAVGSLATAPLPVGQRDVVPVGGISLRYARTIGSGPAALGVDSVRVYAHD